MVQAISLGQKPPAICLELFFSPLNLYGYMFEVSRIDRCDDIIKHEYEINTIHQIVLSEGQTPALISICLKG